MAACTNEIEEGASWPETFAEGLLLSNDARRDMDPLGYRVLLMLPTVYRLSAKTRMYPLAPWVETWALGERYARNGGQGGGEDTAYAKAVLISQ